MYKGGRERERERERESKGGGGGGERNYSTSMFHYWLCLYNVCVDKVFNINIVSLLV